jgi:uncharacterized membrane protein YbhN (UPF0104 family)
LTFCYVKIGKVVQRRKELLNFFMTETLTPPETLSFWKRYGAIIRLLITVLLLGKAIHSIDWQSLEKALPNLDLKWVFACLIMLWISNAISAMRWGGIMDQAGFQKKVWAYVRLYFSGGLINQGLPTTIGGDSYRSFTAFKQLQKHSDSVTPLSHSILGVVLDRSLGFAGNSILGSIGLALGGAVLGAWVPNFGKILVIVMLAGALLLALVLHMDKTKRIYSNLLKRFGIAQGFLASKHAWGFPNIWWQIPLAVAIHFLTLAAFWACLKACHVNAPLEALLIGIPALGLLMILPISISGWGLRETSLASILGLWGLDPTLVILSSIIYGLTTLITFLPGLPRLIQKG